MSNDRKAPRVDKLRLLYALSGNICAFPNCKHPIFNNDGLYIAELCHIEAAKKGGPRFNKLQSEDERRSFENLMFMCHRHHKETDNEIKYPVSKLKDIKAKHELKFSEFGRISTDEMINQIVNESKYYWNVQRSKTFELKELKIERDFDSTIMQLFDELNSRVLEINSFCDLLSESDEELLYDLEMLCKKYGIDYQVFSTIPYYENPIENRNWELHNIGKPNLFSNLKLTISHLRVRVFEELNRSNPEDEVVRTLKDKAKIDFDEEFNRAFYVD